MNAPMPSSTGQRSPTLFASENPSGRPPQRSEERTWLPWIVAAILITILVGLAFWLSGRRGSSSAPAAENPYASQLTIGNIQLSQATNFAGDQLTYIDGTITNRGERTVTAITVRVLFPNDEGEPPQAEQAPFNLIRTREPYVDTEPVSTAPLKPGTSRDFRLIFDDVSPLWNQQIPTIKIEKLTTHP